MDLGNINLTSGCVLVIGDVILDRYWSGPTARISPEAPVPVVRVQQCEERAGGAGNVALNVASLGIAAQLIGVTGTDAAADSLLQILEQRGVQCRFLQVPNVGTVTKLRVLSQHQQLLRLDFEEGFTALDDQALLDRYAVSLDAARIVVLSDYAKGTLRAADRLIEMARARSIPVVVDPKGTGFARYRGASIVTPNLKEFEAEAGKCRDEDDLIERARGLVAQHGWSGLLVTRGEAGMTLVGADGRVKHCRAEAREVYDVTGAGDTVVAVLAVALAAGMSLNQAVGLANTAAGIVVGKLGAATVTVKELQAVLAQQDTGSAICDLTALQALVATARERGERIVMTNGCFDVLHAGHVDYLEKARRLGDRLIVAVNDDASVKRLKGERRPINPLPQRLAVLAALKAVDWVVPFSSDTPRDLICSIRPDVLVKGGDYRPQDIAGADCVTAAGGEVVVIDLVPGCSSTRIIDSLNKTG